MCLSVGSPLGSNPGRDGAVGGDLTLSIFNSVISPKNRVMQVLYKINTSNNFIHYVAYIFCLIDSWEAK